MTRRTILALPLCAAVRSEAPPITLGAAEIRQLAATFARLVEAAAEFEAWLRTGGIIQ